MSFRFSSLQPKRLESSLNLMDYVVHLQQHMTSPAKEELNTSQIQLESLASRKTF